METDTIHDPVTLYVFSCGEHRIARKTQNNNAGCSRCSGKAMRLIASVPRKTGEPEIVHSLRALRVREERIH